MTVHTATPDASLRLPAERALVRTGSDGLISADEWFAGGARVGYDPKSRSIIPPDSRDISPDVHHVFRRIEDVDGTSANAQWVSFLPGWPDGSYGWSRMNRHLSGTDIGPRLFVEYVGHGESDKPLDYPYGTGERADLVEAFWASESVRSTFIVGFDYSSIVALELLARQRDLLRQGREPTTKITGVLLINGGLFADAHSHPWYTTPVLKSVFGGLITSLAQRSRLAFRELMKPLWSATHSVTDAELRELRSAIGRRNGVSALSRSAGFVDEHKRNAERWDLERLFQSAAGTISFHIAGSAEDPFEGRQPVAARERLGAHGLDVRILPGGHLTTSEHPDLLAEMIRDVIGQQPEQEGNRK
ncbi:MAG: alpha/beta hydrolase [Pseudomonadota bacterium]